MACTSGKMRRERARLEQLVEAALGVLAHHDAVEPRADGARVELRGRAEVVRRDRGHQTIQGAALGRERG